MPIYKTLILNKEIAVNYKENEKEKLIAAIKSINLKLESYDNLNGKISDHKLLSFLAIKLQAEILQLNHTNKEKDILEKKIIESNSQNISLNDKLYKLNQENQKLIKDNNLINQELINIQKQIDLIINLIKKTYE